MKSRTIIALFLAAMLTTLSATPLAASNSGAVILQSTGYDVFRPDLSYAQLFQATDNPGIDEMLSDVVAR